MDWRKVILFWTDENAVPPDDPDSNSGIAERMLLSAPLLTPIPNGKTPIASRS